MATELDARELAEALRDMIELITSGRHYVTQNPYTRPEVDRAYKALGIDWRAVK